jgi:riboflavin kinase / FMN adenylyltransferase
MKVAEMKVARAPGELERKPRSVAIGTFDGVHLGHRRVIESALAADRTGTAVTFHPHPRGVVRGNQVELLSTLERRLELLAERGVEETLVVEFTQELSRLEPEEFAERYLQAIGTEVLVAGAGFRFGRERRGDLAGLRELGIDARAVALVPGCSSSEIRALVKAGEIQPAAAKLGRPPELDGVVVTGDARGGKLGYPTANLRVEPDLLVPRYGIYAGSALAPDGRRYRAAVSIGVNPHYGGSERRIEPYLLDFQGDLYGRRLVVELWAYLREEASFESEAALIEQIAADVEATRAARRPS